MGNEAEKLKKRAEKEKDEIKKYLRWIIEKEELLKTTTDQKKREKLINDIEGWHKRSIQKSAEEIGKAGESIKDILPELSLRQREIIMEIFPQGVSSDTLKYAKDRNFRINMIKEDVKKSQILEKEYAYPADMPIEEKKKNKLFKQELVYGFGLCRESNPQDERYNNAWNYKRDLENTPSLQRKKKHMFYDG